MEKFLDYMPCGPASFPYNPLQFFILWNTHFLVFCNFLVLVSSRYLNFRIKQVTRLRDAKVLLSIFSYRHVLILNSVALLPVHTGGVISKHDPYCWFVCDSAKLHWRSKLSSGQPLWGSVFLWRAFSARSSRADLYRDQERGSRQTAAWHGHSLLWEGLGQCATGTPGKK